MGEGSGLGCPEAVLGSVPVRGPAKIPAGGEKAAVLFGPLWRACVLDFNFSSRHENGSEVGVCVPSPVTQQRSDAFQESVMRCRGKSQFPLVSWCPALLQPPERIPPE